MAKEKTKKKRKFRFFNRGIKLGASFMGVGASIEFGGASLYETLSPNQIFWIEIVKYASLAIGAIFASGGVLAQAKDDLKSIKVGEKIRDVVERATDMNEDPDMTKGEEMNEKKLGLEDAFHLAEGLFKRRRKNKKNEK